MTGSIHKHNRQHTSAKGCSKMVKSHDSQFRQSLSTDSTELMNHDDQHKKKLFYRWENKQVDNDSAKKESKQQLKHISVPKLNDNEDKSLIKAFVLNHNKVSSEHEIQHESQLALMKDDLQLAKNIPDHMKKDFCSDTKVAFHAEFVRLISGPLLLCYNVNYKLFSDEEFISLSYMNLNFQYCKLDNAKAQFKCPNTCCKHTWTSARARISFLLSSQDIGFIVLKIFGQHCLRCGTYVHALWYIDEVCRVMKNLAKLFFEIYFPDMINNVDFGNQEFIQNDTTRSRQIRHDPAQRKGKMLAPHAKEYCEACRHGLCFT
ncbi:unnamed protein product [Rotaria sp. Silwood2]|nr:unnamed protein product [Rotaria sp. Silwood2]CAF2972351.1 unnamed protein product [Rotaria sp. Silwood2]CAF3869535.1 unnamed protein product [Rotaria sp. Silwood2]CAF3917030.1 unnamed protein product [Rotaria sp. Silwood2]CAF4242032.1 unnamed protein product [Rotaria sp. Silwood2]